MIFFFYELDCRLSQWSQAVISLMLCWRKQGMIQFPQSSSTGKELKITKALVVFASRVMWYVLVTLCLYFAQKHVHKDVLFTSDAPLYLYLNIKKFQNIRLFVLVWRVTQIWYNLWSDLSSRILVSTFQVKVNASRVPFYLLNICIIFMFSDNPFSSFEG